MARRGWGGSIATAVGVAAGTGAAQLGFGYGLGIINWAPADAGAGPAAWVAGLIWATWIAATSTVLGAVCAYRLHERALAAATAGPRPRRSDAPPDAPAADSGAPAASDPSAADSGPPDAPADSGTPTADSAATPPVRHRGDRLGRVGLAVAAGLGGLITVLLIAVPARVAAAPDTGTPQRVAAAYAAIGVLTGVLAALWALRSRAAATNVIATVAWLWLLAVVAVVDGVLAGRGLTSAQLGIWQISSDRPEFWIRDYLYWPGALLSLGSALVIGLLAVRRGARSAEQRIGAAASGAAGPLLVAVAYLLAVPRLSAISPEQVSAHLIAPYAVIVGIGGSVLVAALAQRAERRAAARSAGGSVPGPSDRPASALEGDEGRPDAAGATTAPGVVGESVPPTAIGGAAAPTPVADVEAAPAGRAAGAKAGTTAATDGSTREPAAPRVPAPRTGEADRLAGAETAAAPATETQAPTSPRRSRSPRRTS
ncbi:hypothetical protein [Micromonospora globbae]|uniref:hypothetical protein n=1 Tax=Micromonospora globbae TaxID=1894969 RepID=UPI003787D5DC